MNKKIGIVTGGGDCPGLNAVIRAVAKAAAMRGWETLGIIGGYDGLLEPRQFRRARLQGARAACSCAAAPSSARPTAGNSPPRPATAKAGSCPQELLDATKAGMEALGISALVSVGGDGSLTIAQQMHEHGIPIVGVPKTIDNDLDGDD